MAACDQSRHGRTTNPRSSKTRTTQRRRELIAIQRRGKAGSIAGPARSPGMFRPTADRWRRKPQPIALGWSFPTSTTCRSSDVSALSMSTRGRPRFAWAEFGSTRFIHAALLGRSHRPTNGLRSTHLQGPRARSISVKCQSHCRYVVAAARKLARRSRSCRELRLRCGDLKRDRHGGAATGLGANLRPCSWPGIYGLAR
jgi:hypothetical protein